MKKIFKSFALVAAFVGMFAFAACNSNDATEMDTIAEDSIEVVEDSVDIDTVIVDTLAEMIAE